MILKVKQNTLKLVLRILNNKESTVPVIAVPPQKDRVLEQNRGTLLPRSLPKKEGIPEDTVENFFAEIDSDPTITPHTVIVAKNGKIVAEKSYSPYTAKCWNTTYSMSKTIVGMAVGLLISEGKLALDTKYQTIFEPNVLLHNFAQKDITVKNLLTMTAGVEFSEAGSVTSTNWVKDFMSGGIKFKPGKEFMYDSMNSYMLSAIVKKVTGQGLVQYLTPRLFKPLGITDIFWELCPKGVEKGGWGLYILPEDMVKLGLLFLNKGNWQGRQILPEKWVEETVTTQVKVPEYIGKYGYGYQIWTGENPKMAIMNGMFGQNIFIMRDTETVIVETGGNSDMFQSNNIFSLVEKYFGAFSAYKKPIVKKQKSADVFEGETLEKLLDKTIFITSITSEKIGFLPTFLQVIQNNYTQGLDKMKFAKKGGHYVCTFYEGDSVHDIPFDFREPVESTVAVGGEKYAVAAQGIQAKNEDGVEVLKLRINFLEMASVREIKIILNGNRVKARFIETPGTDFLIKMLVLMPEKIRTNILFKSILKRVNLDYFYFRLTSALEPELVGTLDPENENDILYEFFSSKIDSHRQSGAEAELK